MMNQTVWLTQNKEKNGLGEVYFPDCQNTFDSPHHKRLVHKIEKQAGRVMDWLREHLTNKRVIASKEIRVEESGT